MFHQWFSIDEIVEGTATLNSGPNNPLCPPVSI
jgi:hypothetical protein